MADLTFIARCYRFFAPRRRLLFTVTAALILLSALAFQRVRLEENIAAMLPDGHSEVAQDFALLEQAPFARKVLISLALAPGADPALLPAAVDGLRTALGPPWFNRTVAGPADVASGNLFVWLNAALPDLLSGSELQQFAAGLDAAAIEKRLRDAYARLLSPEGWALKGLLRRDPLGLNRLGLEKLRYLNMVPQAKLSGGRFLSADGRHALVIADTPVAITDSRGATEMLQVLDRALAGLPAGVRATVVSGHRYTAANAGAIRRDLVVTLLASTLAMLALFFLFLRHWRALFAFLVPVAVLCIAAVAVALGYGKVSAVTVGFGAVLLGISVDFALHVYFALRRGGEAPAAVLATVARPVLFGGLTTIAAFAVLLVSDLPGQRQLAVFAITGLSASLLLSLLVLPHLIPPAAADRPQRNWLQVGQRLPRRWVLGVWLGLLLLCLWPASRVRFDGDLRSLSLVPDNLRTAEKELQTVWGNLRGMALVFAEGPDLAGALANNDRLFAFLRRQPAMAAVSLAPLLPAPATQEKNRRDWAAFWQGAEGERIRSDLAAAAARLGFAPTAFQPFLAATTAPAAAVDTQGLRRAGLGELVEAMILPAGDGYRILTLVPDTPATITLFEAHRDELPGVRLVSQGRFGREVSQAIGHDFRQFLTLAALLVTLLVTLLFRRPRPILLALLPVATGMAVMFGVMGAAGLKFTLLNVVATVLLIGLGVDYGIFMVCRMTEGYDHATDRAVLVSGLTTIAGFGALVLARHPALHSIGVTVLLGIGSAIPAALLVIPAFYRGRPMRRLAILLVLLAATGCSGVPFKPPAPAPTRRLSAGDLLDGLWNRGERVWRIRQSALFEFHGAKVPMGGFLLLDAGRREARLVGLNDMGVKLFDLTVTASGQRENYLFPELARIPGVSGAIAGAVRHIFLAPQPQPGDRLRIEATDYLLTRSKGEEEIRFTFGGPEPLLLEKRVQGGGEKWGVRYFEYRPAAGAMVPGGIVLDDARGYRLTLWLEEVKTNDEHSH